MMVAPPITLPKAFGKLRVDRKKTIHFFSVVPLYRDEMQLKLYRSVDELFDRFDKHGVDEVIRVGRKSVCLPV